MDDGAIPVAIGLRKIITHERIVNSHQHLAKTVDVFLLPSRLSIPQYLSGIAQQMTCPCRQKLCIVVIKIPHGGRPSIDYFNGFVCIFLIIGQIPHNCTIVGHVCAISEVSPADIGFAVRTAKHMCMGFYHKVGICGCF